MSDEDIRWQQRFDNFNKALSELLEESTIAADRELSNLEQKGMIHTFIYTYEMACATMKDLLKHQGVTGLIGPRDTIKEAVKRGIIANIESWMKMITDRNSSVHVYDELKADELFHNVKDIYVEEFEQLQKKLQAFVDKE